MPRHPRVHAEGLLYHVMARGNDGQKAFLRESDYQAFIESLRTVRQRYPFCLYAYVLMSNHFHLLLEVDRFSTARILQSLLTGYVRRFNKTHGRRGLSAIMGICLRGATRRSCAIGMAIYWNWSATFISIRSELRWSKCPATGVGAGTENTWERKSVAPDR